MHTAAYTDADTDSAQIAASVASFFSQFETQENLPLIKQKLAQQLLAEEGSDGAVEEDFDTFWQCGRAPVPLSAKEKLQYLENLENSLKTQVVVQACQRLAHDDPGERLGACVALIRSLRILKSFPRRTRGTLSERGSWSSLNSLSRATLPSCSARGCCCSTMRWMCRQTTSSYSPGLRHCTCSHQDRWCRTLQISILAAQSGRWKSCTASASC